MDSQEKLVGILRLNTSKLDSDIRSAQEKLSNLGNGIEIGGKLSDSLSRQIQQSLDRAFGNVNFGATDKLISGLTTSLERTNELVGRVAASFALMRTVDFGNLTASLDSISSDLKEISTLVETISQKDFRTIITNSFKAGGSAAEEQKAKMQLVRSEVQATIQYASKLLDIYQQLQGTGGGITSLMPADAVVSLNQALTSGLDFSSMTGRVRNANETVLDSYRQLANNVIAALEPAIQKYKELNPAASFHLSEMDTEPIRKAQEALTQFDEKVRSSQEEVRNLSRSFDTLGSSDIAERLSDLGYAIENLNDRLSKMKVYFSDWNVDKDFYKSLHDAFASTPDQIENVISSVKNVVTTLESIKPTIEGIRDSVKGILDVAQNLTPDKIEEIRVALSGASQSLVEVNQQLINIGTNATASLASLKSLEEIVSKIPVVNARVSTSDEEKSPAESAFHTANEIFAGGAATSVVKGFNQDLEQTVWHIEGVNAAGQRLRVVLDETGKVLSYTTQEATQFANEANAKLAEMQVNVRQLKEAYQDYLALLRNPNATQEDIANAKARVDDLVAAFGRLKQDSEAFTSLGMDVKSFAKIIEQGESAIARFGNQVKVALNTTEAKTAAADEKRLIDLLEKQATLHREIASLRSRTETTSGVTATQAENALRIKEQELAATKEETAALVEKNQALAQSQAYLEGMKQIQDAITDSARIEEATRAAQAADSTASQAKVLSDVYREQISLIRQISAENAKALTTKGEEQAAHQATLTNLQQQLAAWQMLEQMILQSNGELQNTEAYLRGQAGVQNANNAALAKEEAIRAKITDQARQAEEAERRRQTSDYTSLLRQELTLRNSIAGIQKQLASATDAEKASLQTALALEMQRLQMNQAKQAGLITNLGLSQEDVAQLRIALGLETARVKAEADLAAQKNKTSIAGRVADSFTRIPEMAVFSVVNSITSSIARMPVQAIREFWNSAWEYANQYYDKLNEIQIVTGKTTEQAARLGVTFRQMARDMSVSSNDIIDAATIFYRQGLDDNDVTSRLEATIMYSRTAGVEAENAANKITAVVNSIDTDARGLEMTAQRVADVFLYLGDNAATSGEEIGTAMQRSAALADAAGVSFEMLGAYIAAVSERTRQDAGVIGTALNAIMSRLTSVKQKGYNEEDETKVNDVAKALAAVNVSLTDGQGQWRRIEDIFQDVANVWDTLDSKTQNYLATVMAGTRQQNVFRTLMADLSQMSSGTSRAMELYEGALNSAGTAASKYAVYTESVTAAHDKMTASMERLYSLFDTNVMKGVYKIGGSLADSAYKLLGGTEIDEYNYGDASSYMNEYTGTIENLVAKLQDYRYVMMYTSDESEEYQAASAGVARILDEMRDKYPELESALSGLSSSYGDTGRAIEIVNGYLRDQYELIEQLRNIDTMNSAKAKITQLGTANTAVREQTGYGAAFRDVFSSDNVMELARSSGDIEGYLETYMSSSVDAILGAQQRHAQQLRAAGNNLAQEFTRGFVESYATSQGITLSQSFLDVLFDENGNFDQEAFNYFSDLFDTMSEDFTKGFLTFTRSASQTAKAEQKALRSEIFQNFVDIGTNSAEYRQLPAELQEVFKTMLQTGLKNGIDEAMWNFEAGDTNAENALMLAATGMIDRVVDAWEQMLPALREKRAEIDEIINDPNYKNNQWGLIEALRPAAEEYLTMLRTNFAGEIKWTSVDDLIADLLHLRTATEETGEATSAFWEKMREESDKYHISQEESNNWKSLTDEISRLLGFASSGDVAAFQQMIASFENGTWTEDQQKSILKTLPWLADFFMMFEEGDYSIQNVSEAAEYFNQKLEEMAGGAGKAEDKLKDLRKIADTAYKAGRAERLRQSWIGSDETPFDTSQISKRDLAAVMRNRGLYRGSVDLTRRPQITESDLGAAGWLDENGRPLSGDTLATLYTSTYSEKLDDGRTLILDVTPILPDGSVLSPEELDDYIDGIVGRANAFGTIGDGSAHLLIDYDIAEDDSQVDSLLEEHGQKMWRLHVLQDAFYNNLVPEEGTFDMGPFLEQLQEFINLGMTFQDLGLGADDGPFAQAIGQYLHARDEMSEEDPLRQEEMNDAMAVVIEWLMSGADAWTQYSMAEIKAAQEEKLPDVLRQLSGAGEDMRSVFNNLSPKMRKLVVESSAAFRSIFRGEKTAAEGAKDLNKEAASLDFKKLEKDGKVWDGMGDLIENAGKKGKEFSKTYGKMIDRVGDMRNAQNALAYIQSGATDDADMLKQAYSDLASYTGVSADSLRNDLEPALWALQSDSEIAGNTIANLFYWLANTSGVTFNSSNWQSELSTLAGSADQSTAAVAQLVQQMLQVAGATISVSADGQVHVNWPNGTPSGFTGTHTSRSSGGGGGGGGGKEKNTKSTEKTISEIQKMTDMMKQIQELFEFHQSMLQQIQSIYENKGELTNLIHVYEEEYNAIQENNKVLEENVKRLEALIPSQQKLVAGLATTDERYEEASKDLERLQSSHQEYTKQLLENVEALDELQNKMRDQKRAIRELEIDIENTILQAIEDRESRIQDLLDGRIAAEEMVMETIISLYERERDSILKTAEARQTALQNELALLDETLNKRKEAADQADKEAELAELEEKLSRISADPTRRAEQLKLQEQIAELRDELAWKAAEDEVEAQKQSIDQQITSLEDYVAYVEEYYEELFEHPKKLIAEMEEILAMTDEEIMAWMMENNEEYLNSTNAVQTDTRNGWQETLDQMRGTLRLHWDEVHAIMAQGDDAIIEFLKENSEDYRQASKLQAEAYVDEWKDKLKELVAAYKDTYQQIQAYSYVPIRTSESSGKSSNSSKGGGGGGNGGNGGNNSSDYYYFNKQGEKIYSTKIDAQTQKWNDDLKRHYGFATGGIATKTGLAWLDGDVNQPERVLSPYQTELFEDLIQSLHSIRVSAPSTSYSSPDMSTNTEGSVVLEGDIVVNVESLSSDEDYEEMANRVMETIADGLSRGTVVGGLRYSK